MTSACSKYSGQNRYAHPFKGEHMSPLMYDLHWLPVEERIVFKIPVMSFKCLMA